MHPSDPTSGAADQDPGRRRLHTALLWLVIAGAAAIAASFFLPGFTVYTEGFIGAGDSQRGFDFDKTFSLFEYSQAWFSFGIVAAIGIAVAAVLGLRKHLRPSRVWITVLALALGLSMLSTTPDFTGQEADGGVTGCTTRAGCGGSFLHDGVESLAQDVEGTKAGRSPGFEFLGGYRAWPELGWQIFIGTSLLLIVLAALSIARLDRRIVLWAPALSIAALACAWIYASGSVCGGSGVDQNESGTAAVLAMYLLGLAALASVGGFTRRWWKPAAIALVAVGIATPIVLLLLLGGSCVGY